MTRPPTGGRTSRLLRGALVGYGHQFAVILVGLWLTPFLLHRLGEQRLGLWLVSGQLLGYLALMDLGVLALLPREVAFASGSPDARDARDRVGRLVSQVRSIVRWQLLLLSAAALFVVLLLPAEWRQLRWPLACTLAAFLALYPARVYVAALQGLQDHAFLARSQLFGWIVGTGVTIAVVLAGGGLYALAAGWICTTGVPAVAAWTRTRGRWPDRHVGDAVEHSGQYFRRSGWVSLGQVAQVLMNGSDVLLLGRLFGPAAVVAYTCTGKLVTVFANHPHLLMHVAQPALSELRASSDRAQLMRVSTALAQAMLVMSGALAIAIVPANRFFVYWWVGSDQWGGIALTVAFAAMMLLRHLNVATVYTLFCFGNERRLSLTSIADGVLSVIATIVLAWLWGPIGAPLGSIAGVLMIGLPINLRSVSRELGVSVGAFLRGLVPMASRIGPLLIVAGLSAEFVGTSSIARLLIVELCLAVTFAAVVVPLVWNGPIGPYVRIALTAMTGRDAIEPVTGSTVERPLGSPL